MPARDMIREDPIAMHELSVCEAIAAIVGTHAAGRRVAAVQVRVGALRQVVPDALTFGWQAVTRDSPLAGSRLDIDQVPAEVECGTCQRRTVLVEPFPRCPACGSIAVRVVAGEELLVTSIDLSDIPDAVKEERDGTLPPP